MEKVEKKLSSVMGRTLKTQEISQAQERENGNGEAKKNAIQKSQAVKLAADRRLFVWSFFCSSSRVKGIGPWGFTLSLRWF